MHASGVTTCVCVLLSELLWLPVVRHAAHLLSELVARRADPRLFLWVHLVVCVSQCTPAKGRRLQCRRLQSECCAVSLVNAIVSCTCMYYSGTVQQKGNAHGCLLLSLHMLRCISACHAVGPLSCLLVVALSFSTRGCFCCGPQLQH
jgi:hypothetical protein